MAPLIPILAAVGAGATGGAAAGTTAAVIGAGVIASSAATIGITVASAVGAFDPDYPEVPTPESSEDATKARARAVRKAQKGIEQQRPVTHQIGPEPIKLGQPTIVGGA
jgi:hypothetical protein